MSISREKFMDLNMENELRCEFNVDEKRKNLEDTT